MQDHVVACPHCHGTGELRVSWGVPSFPFGDSTGVGGMSMIQAVIVEKEGKYVVRRADGRKVYGAFREYQRALSRRRHVYNSSLPRREKGVAQPQFMRKGA